MAKVTWNDASTEERILRVEKLVETLESMPLHDQRKHFDMSSWMESNHCGTVGCAAGHCALNPWFKRRGFGFDIKSGDFTHFEPNDFFGEEIYSSIFVNPKFTDMPAGRESYKAVLAAARATLASMKADAAEDAASDAAQTAREEVYDLTN